MDLGRRAERTGAEEVKDSARQGSPRKTLELLLHTDALQGNFVREEKPRFLLCNRACVPLLCRSMPGRCKSRTGEQEAQMFSSAV